MGNSALQLFLHCFEVFEAILTPGQARDSYPIRECPLPLSLSLSYTTITRNTFLAQWHATLLSLLSLNGATMALIDLCGARAYRESRGPSSLTKCAITVRARALKGRTTWVAFVALSRGTELILPRDSLAAGYCSRTFCPLISAWIDFPFCCCCLLLSVMRGNSVGVSGKCGPRVSKLFNKCGIRFSFYSDI